MFVDSWLLRAAAQRPQQTAIETPAAALTYGRLRDLALQAAASLCSRGVVPGARVAIALPAGIDFAVALHATWLCGAIAVPIDLRLTSAERAGRAGADALLLDQPVALSAPEERRSGAQAERPAGAPTARPSHAPGAAPLTAQHDLDAIAVEIFTSGTSAEPKRVRLTFGNFLYGALASAVAIGSDPDDRWLCAMPPAHVGGLSILVRSAIFATTALVHERFDAVAVRAALLEGQVSLVSLVPTMLERLLQAGLHDPPALRCALIGGGPIGAELLARARQAAIPVRASYGLSESCAQAATEPLLAGDGGARPLFCTRLKIAENGEILLNGPTIAPGARAADGWLHTGDLGEIDARGALRVRGRISEVIISGGENVVPEEVEAAIESHPDVAEAAVIGRPDAQWGEAVTALLVAAPGVEALDEAALRKHLRVHLAPFKIPKRFELRSEPLPRSAAGKLLRRKLRS